VQDAGLVQRKNLMIVLSYEHGLCHAVRNVDAPDEFSQLLAKLVSVQLDDTEVGFKGRHDAIVQQYFNLVSDVAVGYAKAQMHILIAEVLDCK